MLFKRNLNFMSLALTFTSLSFASIGLACQNHIYNNSHGNWTIQYTVTDDSGGVAMNGTDCPPDSTKCTLPPGGVIEVDYYNGGFSTTKGNVYVTDSYQLTKSFKFGQDRTACEYIQHSGDTGAISVNDPANGDISIWKDYWNQVKAKK